jgi:hypothetical protein
MIKLLKKWLSGCFSVYRTRRIEFDIILCVLGLFVLYFVSLHYKDMLRGSWFNPRIPDGEMLGQFLWSIVILICWAADIIWLWVNCSFLIANNKRKGHNLRHAEAKWQKEKDSLISAKAELRRDKAELRRDQEVYLRNLMAFDRTNELFKREKEEFELEKTAYKRAQEKKMGKVELRNHDPVSHLEV